MLGFLWGSGGKVSKEAQDVADKYKEKEKKPIRGKKEKEVKENKASGNKIISEKGKSEKEKVNNEKTDEVKKEVISKEEPVLEEKKQYIDGEEKVIKTPEEFKIPKVNEGMSQLAGEPRMQDQPKGVQAYQETLLGFAAGG